MAEEIEAKILEVDPGSVAETLADIGAEQVFDGEVRSLFFDFPSGEIEENGILRVRKRGDDVFITLKKDISRKAAKRMEEIEFYVDSLELAREFLFGLGLEQLHTSRKDRQIWKKGEVVYVIDRYPDIPPLLEVEAPTMEALERTVRELGYDVEDMVSWDAKQVMDHYGKSDW